MSGTVEVQVTLEVDLEDFEGDTEDDRMREAYETLMDTLLGIGRDVTITGLG